MKYIKKKKAIKNRRRIASECNRTRKLIDNILLKEYPNAHVIVAGDLNDGPGFDYFSEYYILFESVERLMGSPFNNKKLLRAVLLEHSNFPKELLYSCVFDDYVDKIMNKGSLVDHIFVSNNLDSLCNYCGISHDLWIQHSSTVESNRKKRLSDHRPVFCDFAVEEKPQQ